MSSGGSLFGVMGRRRHRLLHQHVCHSVASHSANFSRCFAWGRCIPTSRTEAAIRQFHQSNRTNPSLLVAETERSGSSLTVNSSARSPLEERVPSISPVLAADPQSRTEWPSNLFANDKRLRFRGPFPFSCSGLKGLLQSPPHDADSLTRAAAGMAVASAPPTNASAPFPAATLWPYCSAGRMQARTFVLFHERSRSATLAAVSQQRCSAPPVHVEGRKALTTSAVDQQEGEELHPLKQYSCRGRKDAEMTADCEADWRQQLHLKPEDAVIIDILQAKVAKRKRPLWSWNAPKEKHRECQRKDVLRVAPFRSGNCASLREALDPILVRDNLDFLRHYGFTQTQLLQIARSKKYAVLMKPTAVIQGGLKFLQSKGIKAPYVSFLHRASLVNVEATLGPKLAVLESLCGRKHMADAFLRYPKLLGHSSECVRGGIAVLQTELGLERGLAVAQKNTSLLISLPSTLAEFLKLLHTRCHLDHAEIARVLSVKARLHPLNSANGCADVLEEWFGAEGLHAITRRHVQMLARSPGNLHSTLSILDDVLASGREALLSAIVRYPMLLCASPKLLARNRNSIQSLPSRQQGTVETLSNVHSEVPATETGLVHQPADLGSQSDQGRGELSLMREQAHAMVLRCPGLLGLDFQKVLRVVAYLWESCGIAPYHVPAHLGLFSPSFERTVKPRCEHLLSRGFVITGVGGKEAPRDEEEKRMEGGMEYDTVCKDESHGETLCLTSVGRRGRASWTAVKDGGMSVTVKVVVKTSRSNFERRFGPIPSHPK